MIFRKTQESISPTPDQLQRIPLFHSPVQHFGGAGHPTILQKDSLMLLYVIYVSNIFKYQNINKLYSLDDM